MQLIIGNKNYSSWSMRPWVFLTAFDMQFSEVIVSLQASDLHRHLKQYSNAAKVPVLNDGELQVWDSLAICEYINDEHLAGAGWPTGKQDRAIARSLAAEMHSSFAALRNEMPMNIRASRVIEPSQACLRDIARIDEIWSTYAKADANGSSALLGQFSIADCMYAPVVMRFATYHPELSRPAQQYADWLRTHPAVQSWVDGALKEVEIVDIDEAGIDR